MQTADSETLPTQAVNVLWSGSRNDLGHCCQTEADQSVWDWSGAHTACIESPILAWDQLSTSVTNANQRLGGMEGELQVVKVEKNALVAIFFLICRDLEIENWKGDYSKYAFWAGSSEWATEHVSTMQISMVAAISDMLVCSVGFWKLFLHVTAEKRQSCEHYRSSYRKWVVLWHFLAYL